MPTTLRQMQSYCGFLSSLSLYTSNKLSYYHGVLAELTSAKKEFRITDKRREAFRRLKEILVDAPLFIHYPDPSAPKLLFVDSSDILLGAVLFDVVFPPITLLEHECEFDIESMRQNNRVIQQILDEIDLPAFPISITSCPDSSFFESLSYLTKQLLIENAPENHKLLRQAVLYHLE